MIQTRRRFLMCAGLAAAVGAGIARREPAAAARHRLAPPEERAYGLIEDIDDRQLGEYLALGTAPPASSYRARPG
jgi:hypothetical protein